MVCDEHPLLIVRESSDRFTGVATGGVASVVGGYPDYSIDRAELRRVRSSLVDKDASGTDQFDFFHSVCPVLM